MTELEELKNHIEALEKRVEASDKKIALLEETLSTLGKFKASKEMGEYIERQQNAIRMADMLSSFSDETIDMTVQKASVAKIQKHQASINEQIAAAIKKSKANVVQNDGSSLKYLKYKTIGNEIAITGCTAFDPVDIVIPDTVDGKPVTSIQTGAFENTSIKGLILANNLMKIDDRAFSHCQNLEYVFNLNCDIGNAVFEGCIRLSKIEFKKGITTIGQSAFARCDSLTNVDLENTGVSVLSFGCFNASGLKKISFPNTLRKIEGLSLYSTKIEHLIIPDNVAEVTFPFIGSSLNNVNLDIAFCSKDTRVYYRGVYGTTKICIYCLPGSNVQKTCQEKGLICRPLSEFPIK